MALKTPQVPVGTDQLVAGAMQRAVQSGALSQSLAAAAAGGGPTPLRTAAPHEVFVMRLDDIVDDRGIQASAQSVGWRVLVVDGQAAVAAVEFDASAAGAGGGAVPTATEFKAFNVGRFVQGTVEGIERAEAAAQVKANDYEVRLLEVPAIYLVVLWLHRPDDDWFVPLKPAPNNLATDRLYSEQELLSEIQPLAQRKQHEDNSPRSRP